jgi:hypothetical protein
MALRVPRCVSDCPAITFGSCQPVVLYVDLFLFWRRESGKNVNVALIRGYMGPINA